MSNIINQSKTDANERIDRLERYETLAPGQFWRVSTETPLTRDSNYIDVGEVLELI